MGGGGRGAWLPKSRNKRTKRQAKRSVSCLIGVCCTACFAPCSSGPFWAGVSDKLGLQSQAGGDGGARLPKSRNKRTKLHAYSFVPHRSAALMRKAAVGDFG